MVSSRAWALKLNCDQVKSQLNGSFYLSWWFRRMVDVIGWRRAVSGVVTVYKCRTLGVPTLFFPCAYIQYAATFCPHTFKPSWFSVYFTSSTVCPALSICIPPLNVLPFSPRPTDAALFAWISHFLFGVCIWSLVLVPSTHQTLMLLKMRKGDRKEDTYTQKAYKWQNNVEWERCVCGERIRITVWGQWKGKSWIIT